LVSHPWHKDKCVPSTGDRNAVNMYHVPLFPRPGR
jgi:hypothetical protein